MVVQPDNYKEDLACVATEPLTIDQNRNRAERGLMESCAYWVRRTCTYGIDVLVLKVADDASKIAGWQEMRCPREVRLMMRSFSVAKQAEVAMAVRGLAHVAEINHINALKMWSKAAVTTIPTPIDTVHNDIEQYWWDATTSSDEDRERHGTSWGTKTNEELEADFIEHRATTYFTGIMAYLRDIDSSGS
jgi:hypothetical protein